MWLMCDSSRLRLKMAKASVFSDEQNEIRAKKSVCRLSIFVDVHFIKFNSVRTECFLSKFSKQSKKRVAYTAQCLLWLWLWVDSCVR